jgi:hypothetical protein
MTTTPAMKVVRVITDREVAVSGGAEAGLEVGDTLLILGDPVPITDPDTNEVLGEVVPNKAIVRVYDVKDRFALARTFRSRTVNVGGQGVGSLRQYFEPPKYETRTETLRRSPAAGDILSPDESIVEVGDRVEKFEGDVEDVPSSSVWR